MTGHLPLGQKGYQMKVECSFSSGKVLPGFLEDVNTLNQDQATRICIIFKNDVLVNEALSQGKGIQM